MRNECRSSYRLSLNAYPTGVQGFFGSLAGCWCRSSSRGEGYDNYRFENLGSAHPRSVASSSSSSAVSAGHCLRCRRGPLEPQGTARGGLLGPWLPGFGSMRRRRIGAGSLSFMIRHGRNRFNCDAARRPVQWRCLSHFASHCERSAGAFAGSPAQAGGAPYAHCDAAYRAWVPLRDGPGSMIRALAPSMPCSARRPRPRPCSSGACSRSATPFAGPTSAGAKLQACRSAFGIRTVNAVRLQLHALAYNLSNFLCTLALP